MVNEKRDPCDLDYVCDEMGELLYWDPVECKQKILMPAEPILDPALCLGKIGQQNILPEHFTLKKRDLQLTSVCSEAGQQIGEPILPGISSYIFWGTKEANQSSACNFTQEFLGREFHSKNRIFVAMVADILKAGWIPYFAPLIDSKYSTRNPLHVILVPCSILDNPMLNDAFVEEKIRIAESFVKW